MTLIRGAGYDDQAKSWIVPQNYNIARDVADWQDRGALAMIWADSGGRHRNVFWGEMRDCSCQFAHWFTAQGVIKGDVVTVLLPALPETAASYLGVYRTGAILLTMSTLWSDEQILIRLRASQSRVVLTDATNASRLCDVEGLAVLVLSERALAEWPTAFDNASTSAHDPAQLYYTSGTSGPAKGILHAHRNLVGHNEFEYCHGLSAGDIFYGAGEWAWSYAKLMGPWRYGAVQFVFRHEDRLDPSELLRALSFHGVTAALLNPTLIRLMQCQAEPESLLLQQSFRQVCSSSEPLPADALEWFRQTFGVTVLEYYGSTESYPMLGSQIGDVVRPGSTGHPLPGWDVALLDDDEQEVAQGSEGEICLRARSNPQYPLGIWKDPGRAAQIFGGHWYRSGDIACVDSDGFWFYRGRKDDLIKTSGYRVGPYEVEAVLNAHDLVQESGIVGVPDALRGQRIHAFVVLRADADASESVIEDLQRWVKDHYSKFAYPRSFTFLNGLPKSATGKIQRSALRAQVVTEDAK